jgi:hypothetical protein
MSSPTPVLPPELSAKLAALATRPAHSETRYALDAILSELANLPAHFVVRASREIATSASLGWWQPEKRPIQIIPTHGAPPFSWLKYRLGLEWVPSDNELLAANPNFAWLFLFHPNGYVREDALNSIDSPPTSPFFFAALAWRLNDWVAPVRQAAERCAKRVLHRTAPDVAANAALYLLDRRLVWSRWSDEPKALDTIFGQEDVIAALASQLQKSSTGPLATCLRNTLRYPNIDEHLPRLAAAAVQPLVRAVAYQCLVFGKASWAVGFEWAWIDKVYGLRKRAPVLETRDVKKIGTAADFIREAAHDKSPFVRRVAADALIAARSQLPDEAALIAHLANDQSSAVRSRADFMLRHPPSEASS